MKSKLIAGGLAAASILVFSAAPGLAQRGGFQAGIAQHPIGPPPQIPMVASPSTFRVVPGFNVPPPPVVPFPVVPLVPSFPTVIIPNLVLVPGQTAFPPQSMNPYPIAVLQANPLQPGFPLPAGGPALQFVGTPRAEVLRQFGPPMVTIITNSGETLHFQGGVTVIIQNGQVAGPR